MALGTYNRETQKRKQQVPSPGPLDEGLDAKSGSAQGSAAPVQPVQIAEERKPLDTLVRDSKLAPVQLSNEAFTRQNVGATPPPVQNGGTFQEPQSNVIPDGGIKNNQGEVNKGTGASLESQVGPVPVAGGKNQGGQVPDGSFKMEELYNNNAQTPVTNPMSPVGTNFMNSAPLSTNGVKTFNGLAFNTVTTDGHNLSDTDIEGYYNMLRQMSEETGKTIEELDSLGANLLVSGAPSQGATGGMPRPADNPTPTGGNAGGTPVVSIMPPKGTAASGAPASEEQQYYDNWKDFSLEQLQDMLPANSGIPAKKAALERLISEKGGNGTAPAQGPAVGATPAPRYTRRQQARRDAAAKEMTNKDVYNGNVDLLKRPSVDAATMHAAGYTDIPDGYYASVYSMQNGFRDKSKKGKVREILYTPIMADGTVLSQKEVDDYITDLGKRGDIVELDKPENGGKGLVIAADVAGDLGPELHRLQEEYYSTPEDYAAKDEEARKKVKTSFGSGNLDPLGVKPVSRDEMEKAGWGGPFDEEDISVYPIEQTIIDSNGNKHVVIMSPIQADGTIVPMQEFEEYIDSLQGSKDIMDNDKNARSLIIKFDAAKDESDDLYYAMRDVDYEKNPIDIKPSTFEVERTNDVHQSLSDDYDRAAADVDEQEKLIRRFIENPSEFSRGQLAIKTRDDKLKEEGLDKESEKRIEKRRKRSNLIANIGDILQGFANLAGTWYGAKSSELSSLSAASRTGDEKVDEKRKTRRDEIMKSYEKSIDKIGDDMLTDLKRLERVMDRANDRLRNYEVATGKEAQRASNREKQREQDFENKSKLMDKQQQYKRENAATAQKYKKELKEIDQNNRFAYRAFSAEKSKEVKQTPGASSKSTGRKTNGGKRKRNGGGGKPASRE